MDEIVEAVKPSTPETERATDSEESGPESNETSPSPTEGEAEASEETVETETVIQDLEDAVKEATEEEDPSRIPNIDDLDEGTPAINDKPPTPMPE